MWWTYVSTEPKGIDPGLVPVCEDRRACIERAKAAGIWGVV